MYIQGNLFKETLLLTWAPYQNDDYDFDLMQKMLWKWNMILSTFHVYNMSWSDCWKTYTNKIIDLNLSLYVTTTWDLFSVNGFAILSAFAALDEL